MPESMSRTDRAPPERSSRQCWAAEGVLRGAVGSRGPLLPLRGRASPRPPSGMLTSATACVQQCSRLQTCWVLGFCRGPWHGCRSESLAQGPLGNADMRRSLRPAVLMSL